MSTVVEGSRHMVRHDLAQPPHGWRGDSLWPGPTVTKVRSSSKDLDEGRRWREGKRLAAATHARTMTKAEDQ